MDWSIGSERIHATPSTSAELGTVRWSPVKSIWIGSHTLAALILGPLFFSWDALAVFLILTGLTLCAGHSVGMHRRFIHNSFECPKWLEYALVYQGVLVGMAGPFGMMHQHDLRDWAQRQSRCHDYLKHGRSLFEDGWWQLHCDLRLKNGPTFTPEHAIRDSRFYNWLEQTWMLQQIPVGLLLFICGGWDWVIWGICARVCISVTGHWLVGYFAHNHGPRRWHVKGAGVQGHDVPIAALISMGESWHNNHHAYPGSARLGLNADQPDPGWWLLLGLKSLGLAWNIQTPETLGERPSLTPLTDKRSGCALLQRLQALQSPH
ncbi:MAG: acyl-CoA desaturase [Asticcacaulis sp.]